jgi:hypothetical protein
VRPAHHRARPVHRISPDHAAFLSGFRGIHFASLNAILRLRAHSGVRLTTRVGRERRTISMFSKTLVAVLITSASAIMPAPCRAQQSTAPTPATPDDPPAAQTTATPGQASQIRLTANVLTTDDRPSALMPLYVSLAALQITDGVATTWGVNHGRVESNPAFQPFANNPPALWAVKAGTTAGAIYLTEHLWRHGHKGEAIATMVVSNGILVAVTARNASVLRSSH